MIDREHMERDLAEHLADREGTGLLPRSEDPRLTTHLLEAHRGRTLGEARTRLETTVHGSDDSLRATDDASLFLLTVELEGDEAAGFWVDVGNPRFWLLHSKSRVQLTRQALHRLVARNPELDLAWLPGNEIRWVQHTVGPPTGERAGGGAEGAYELVEHHGFTRWAMAVAGVAFCEGGHTGTQVMRLTRDGCLQSQGPSLDSHIGVAHRLLSRYARFVLSLERTFALRVSEADGGDIIVQGRPMSLEADRPEGLAFDQLIGRMLSGVEPFRLLGSVDWRDGDLAWVEAVDLHLGTPLRMDLTPEWLRLYLGTDLCGNTLARFLTNLQRAYNADLRFLDEAAEGLLATAAA